jgi:hypothetical protein
MLFKTTRGKSYSLAVTSVGTYLDKSKKKKKEKERIQICTVDLFY